MGGYSGKAYFNGLASALPAAGAVGNATLIAKRLRDTTSYVLEKFEVLA